MAVSQGRHAHDSQGGVGIVKDAGPYIGIVMANTDSLYSGRLQVWIPEFGGDKSGGSGDQANWRTVSWASPYYGITQSPTPSSYGMWMVPPDVGIRVLVVFVNGDHSRGYWFACVPEIAHGKTPALGGLTGKPELEFDPASSTAYTASDLKSVPRSIDQVTLQTFTAQGLENDKVRGPIDSSTYRESPSKVVGWSTPGGHSFVMDDGGQGKVYRLRSSQGNELMLNDSTGTIYAINSKGTAWFELSASGQIDCFGAAGINMATKGSINLHADQGINIHSGSALKLVGMAAVKISSAVTSIFGSTLSLEGVKALNIHSCGDIMLTATQNFHQLIGTLWTWSCKCISSTPAKPVKIPPKPAEQVAAEKPSQVSGYSTTTTRAPSKEPYTAHDNGSGGGGNGPANNPQGSMLANKDSMLKQAGLTGQSIQGNLGGIT